MGTQHSRKNTFAPSQKHLFTQFLAAPPSKAHSVTDVYISEAHPAANIATYSLNLLLDDRAMDFMDKDWDNTSNPEDMHRYQKDGRDLCAPINQGQRIFDLRSLADISVDELAEKSGITPQTLLALEAGLRQLRPALAVRLAANIGVSFSDLWVNDAN